MIVFSNAIKFLTDDMVLEANKKLAGGISKSDVKWVLTVPAIWTDGAKQFMLEAAIEVIYIYPCSFNFFGVNYHNTLYKIVHILYSIY